MKYRNIPREYKLSDLAKETTTHIVYDEKTHSLQIFGPKANRDEAASRIIIKRDFMVKMISGIRNTFDIFDREIICELSDVSDMKSRILVDLETGFEGGLVVYHG